MSDAARQQKMRTTLTAIQKGDPKAAEELLPLVYEELRDLAHYKLAKEKAGQTLQTTALVHEAYIRVVGDQDPKWENKAHFFASAALAMRRILVEQARKKGRVKHGGGRHRIPLEPGAAVLGPPATEFLALNEALCRLEEIDKRKAEVVTLRHLAGLTVPETAKAVGMSTRTVELEWRFARAWLLRELRKGGTTVQGRDSDE